MRGFDFSTAGEIRFGEGRAPEAAHAALALGRRVLVVTGRTPARAEWLTDALRRGGAVVAIEPVPGEPDLAVVEAALARLRDFGAEVVVALGGGSAIDAGKALAALAREAGGVRPHLEVVGEGRPLSAEPLPMIALPTTAGTGAEVTRNAVIGVPEEGRKVSLRDRRLLPRLAIVDPALTAGLPAAVRAATGLDALTQVIEPYLSPFATPMTDALCRDAIPRGLAALPRAVADPSDSEALAAMAWVSLCGGIALANAKLGAVHGLAGVIGGRTGAAHGAICGRLLAPVLAANREALAARAPGSPALGRLAEVGRMVASALGVPEDDALPALGRLVDDLAIPSRRDLGIADADVPAIAGASGRSSSMRGNPVELTGAELEAVLLGA